GEMLFLSAEGRHGAIDHTKGKWSCYRSFFHFASQKHVYELDFYVLTSYEQTENNSLLYLMESKTLGEVYLPTPVSEEEESLLTAFAERAEAANTQVHLYGDEIFSLGELSLQSLSLHKNRLTSAAGFSITYGDHELLFFSPTFQYEPSFYFRMQSADAVCFGARGGEECEPVFPSILSLGDVACFGSDENKTPFKNTDGYLVVDTHTLQWKASKNEN
ncbi:MAG: hypothetical protein J6W28_00770, partial [Clostridia bacterium]|nr:hypothetical protein [Clostridia bacterium]